MHITFSKRQPGGSCVHELKLKTTYCKTVLKPPLASLPVNRNAVSARRRKDKRSKDETMNRHVAEKAFSNQTMP
ncbi:hypothetical protein GCT13_39875 [Paraburkholderia sp. CNPSo 3157]|uniref:Uncharacterized protein n=1 Tax=Paraburkholderia franconis TaxID=2654983 RepID=A0A7X1TKV7_9BURK|nr:hypothetical protein [Paraburkholderia franconis]MPW22799.1 hypothetical protein [Paraburkholderia franconis]